MCKHQQISFARLHRVKFSPSVGCSSITNAYLSRAIALNTASSQVTLSDHKANKLAAIYYAPGRMVSSAADTSSVAAPGVIASSCSSSMMLSVPLNASRLSRLAVTLHSFWKPLQKSLQDVETRRRGLCPHLKGWRCLQTELFVSAICAGLHDSLH